MAKRSLGWVQDSTDVAKLKNIASIFVPNSEINRKLREDLIPNVVWTKCDKKKMLQQLSSDPVVIDYSILKGNGAPKGYTRATAPVSGIAQAVLPGQSRGKYQSDWAANSFIVWAIAIGLLKYDAEKDQCSITESGTKYALSTDSENDKQILREAFLSYPPVCRILSLLNSAPDNTLTKYEIGNRFGFVGEMGFTCFSLHFILEGLQGCANAEERKEILSNTEGTSDKYVRTICSWLESVDWVKSVKKTVSDTINGKPYSDTLPAFQLSFRGRQDLNKAYGKSKHKQITKIVDFNMLATKAPDKDYLCKRRSILIKYLNNAYHSSADCVRYLSTFGFDEIQQSIEDDIRGFENIGLSVVRKASSKEYTISDSLIITNEPAITIVCNKSNTTLVKDSIRPYLANIDHKYLSLIDYGFDTTKGADKFFELLTAELLTSELAYIGKRLGQSRKPDVCVYHGTKGLILDNKAYGKGYSIPISQADEMARYIDENKSRDALINPNQWWLVFDPSVNEFHFSFISGSFTGRFRDNLQNIQNRTSTAGAVISSANLLLLAEEIKAGKTSYDEAFNKFGCMDEIIIARP